MFASHESCVIGGEVVVAQGLVNGDAVALDLDDYGVALSGKGSFYVQLDGVRGPHAYGQSERASQFRRIIGIDGCSCEKNCG